MMVGMCRPAKLLRRLRARPTSVASPPQQEQESHHSSHGLERCGAKRHGARRNHEGEADLRAEPAAASASEWRHELELRRFGAERQKIWCREPDLNRHWIRPQRIASAKVGLSRHSNAQTRARRLCSASEYCVGLSREILLDKAIEVGRAELL